MREGDRRKDGRTRTDVGLTHPSSLPLPARTADGLGWKERGSPRAPSASSSSPPPHSSSTVASPKLISELVFCPSAVGSWERGDGTATSAFAVIRGELTGRGRTTGRRLNQSASLSLLRPVALCVYLVDKFWRKMTMTTIITRAAVVLVREGDRRPRGRRRGGEAGPVCVYETRVFWDAGGGEAAAAEFSESSLSLVDRI